MSTLTAQFFGPLADSTTWTTREGVPMKVDALSPKHRRNILKMLRDNAEQQKEKSLVALNEELFDSEDFERTVELHWEVDKLRTADATDWLNSTPLVQALLALEKA